MQEFESRLTTYFLLGGGGGGGAEEGAGGLTPGQFSCNGLLPGEGLSRVGFGGTDGDLSGLFLSDEFTSCPLVFALNTRYQSWHCTQPTRAAAISTSRTRFYDGNVVWAAL